MRPDCYIGPLAKRAQPTRLGRLALFHEGLAAHDPLAQHCHHGVVVIAPREDRGDFDTEIEGRHPDGVDTLHGIDGIDQLASFLREATPVALAYRRIDDGRGILLLVEHERSGNTVPAHAFAPGIAPADQTLVSTAHTQLSNVSVTTEELVIEQSDDVVMEFASSEDRFDFDDDAESSGLDVADALRGDQLVDDLATDKGKVAPVAAIDRLADAGHGRVLLVAADGNRYTVPAAGVGVGPADTADVVDGGQGVESVHSDSSLFDPLTFWFGSLGTGWLVWVLFSTGCWARTRAAEHQS